MLPFRSLRKCLCSAIVRVVTNGSSLAISRGGMVVKLQYRASTRIHHWAVAVQVAPELGAQWRPRFVHAPGATKEHGLEHLAGRQPVGPAARGWPSSQDAPVPSRTTPAACTRCLRHAGLRGVGHTPCVFSAASTRCSRRRQFCSSISLRPSRRCRSSGRSYLWLGKGCLL